MQQRGRRAVIKHRFYNETASLPAPATPLS